MSLIAGIFSRDKSASLDDVLVDTLTTLISRNPSDTPIIFRDKTCFLVKVDIGAYSERAFQVCDNYISMLAGEPLLDFSHTTIAHRTRSEDLEVISKGLVSRNFAPLCMARGIFCGVHYEPNQRHLYLFTDRLGERPLYFWLSDKWVIFSSALRVLEGLDIPRCMDLCAVSEISTLGFPLNDRTPYKNIFRLRASELAQFEDSAWARQYYWRWDQLSISKASDEELLDNLHDAFSTAVAIRAYGDASTFACLSGGLDSRCVVTALRARGITVHSLNFAPTASQDKVFASEYAKAVGSIHYEDPDFYDSRFDLDVEIVFPFAISRMLKQTGLAQAELPARPRMMWTGDGGSVGVGHVYLSEGVCRYLACGNLEGAIQAYIDDQRAYLPPKMLNTNLRGALSAIPKAGIVEELNNINCNDELKRFYLFLLLNDQHRHLSSYYESIDLHRLEFQVPFFDSKFLEVMVSIPTERCLYHRFYTKWLSCFTPVITSVPWQSYPGHEPCPLPVSASLGYQFGGANPYADQRLAKSKYLRSARLMLSAKDFPSHIMNKPFLRFMTIAYQLGLRDYTYAFQVAWIYHKYSKTSLGNYSTY